VADDGEAEGRQEYPDGHDDGPRRLAADPSDERHKGHQRRGHHIDQRDGIEELLLREPPAMLHRGAEDKGKPTLKQGEKETVVRGGVRQRNALHAV